MAMALTRREFLGSAASAALLSGGFYRSIDRIAKPITRGARPTSASVVDQSSTLPLEQHLFQGLSTLTDNGTVVTIPPLHHTVVTAVLNVPPTTSELQNAQTILESAISELEDSGLLDFMPSGLGLAVAWGLSYFNLLPASLTSGLLPIDVAASNASNSKTLAILDAVTFASDPPETILEQNDIAFVFASDQLDHIASATDAIFSGPPADLLTVTSIRQGFVDGHNVGSSKKSLTKKMAVKARVPGAASIPNSAELFLGFTSTQQAALGQTTIANFETLPGMTDQWPNGYFVNGTTMHLSHIHEDLVAWYGSSQYIQRAGAAFSPTTGAGAKPGTQTLPEGPSNVAPLAQIKADLSAHGFIGHSSSLQPVSRIAEPVTDNYGNFLSIGTAIPQRADFNTLDNPFSFSSNPQVDRMRSRPAAGVHFVVFMPTSGSFTRLRNAMDGQYGQGGDLGPKAVHGPFNNVLQTTHRQNFLVPPRAHRSFPLAELLT